MSDVKLEDVREALIADMVDTASVDRDYLRGLVSDRVMRLSDEEALQEWYDLGLGDSLDD